MGVSTHRAQVHVHLQLGAGDLVTAMAAGSTRSLQGGWAESQQLLWSYPPLSTPHPQSVACWRERGRLHTGSGQAPVLPL